MANNRRGKSRNTDQLFETNQLTQPQKTQKSIAEKIPQEWRLPKHLLDPSIKDVSGIPASCGILSSEELDITTRDSTCILEKIQSRAWTAEKVTLAFCKRAAIAQQLVSSRKFLGWSRRKSSGLRMHIRSTA
jgi:hypothetical protein